jgi:DNA-binding response OmpR family regulator
VIDDDPTILQLIKDVLTDEGFTVEAEPSGVKALEMAHAARPDLVVLDMYIPGLSGRPLVQALRRRFGAGLPVLLTSASSMDDEVEGIGAYECLPKPFDIDELLAAVRRGLPASS